MKQRSILWLFGPLLLGLLIALLVLAAPAQARQPAQPAAGDTAGFFPHPGDDAFGIVESLPDGLIGSWTIGGTVYTATEQTHFSTFGGEFSVGACVWVSYDPSSYTAYAIGLVGGADRCSHEAGLRFTGVIEQVPDGYPASLHPSPGISGTWVISGTEFVSTEQTRLDTHSGPLAVGACANVEYHVENDVNIADEISSAKIYRCLGPFAFNQAYGTLVSFPDNQVGAWVISDTTGMTLSFMTTPASRVWTHHYPLEVGACVWVKYYTNQDVNIATGVMTQNARRCEGHFVDFQPLSKIYATVDSLPPTTTMTGTWTLAGVNFTSTQQTRIDLEEGPLEVGACAESKYDPTNGAMLMRKLEGEEPSDCQAQDGSPQFRLYGVVELMPTAGYTGTWQVSGVSFTVNPSTTVESRHGEFMTGAFVKVYFTYDSASGERTAQLLKTHVAPGFGRFNFRGHFGGVIHNHLTGDQVMLDGTAYQLDPDADVSAALKVGDMAWINLYQEPDGAFVTQVLQDQTVFLPLIPQ